MPPCNTPTTPSNIEKYINNDLFELIFPYSKVSTVYTHDNEPFWRLEDLVEAIRWLNNNSENYKNFGTDSSDHLVNVLEICAFLANFNQETGWDLAVPYPYSYPKVNPSGEPWEGFAGGGLGILEGGAGEVYFGDSPPFEAEMASKPLKLSQREKQVLKVQEDKIGGLVRSLVQMNQPQFGLGSGTGNGAVFLPGYVSVSDDGTLWGDAPVNEKVGKVYPTSQYILNLQDRRYASMGPYCQYSGRGAIQLSYNYNYSECSIALFGDYRLVKYPNLIITSDRETFNGKPYYFGFPGPNQGGNNELPEEIKRTTPSARVLAWLTSLWFWNDKNRSGRSMSCHQCMLEPQIYGITGCNLIINNDSGCQPGWAFKKNNYYRRITRIFGIPQDITEKSIICPPNNKNLRK